MIAKCEMLRKRWMNLKTIEVDGVEYVERYETSHLSKI